MSSGYHDRGYNYKTYENYEEQLAGLFFARVDTYARDSSKAPAPGHLTAGIHTSDDLIAQHIALRNIFRAQCKVNLVGILTTHLSRHTVSATGNTFSDRVFSNNRVVWYEVTVIDKYLNRSAVKAAPCRA